jgi:hypothetical protein
MTPVAGPPPVSRMPRSELTVTVAVIAVLTVVAAVVGTLEWPLPERVSGGWQIADVPTSLIALLTVSTLICLLAATALTVRSARLRLGEPAALGWLLIVLAATGALVFNALVLAADAAVVVGAVIPVLHWLFTLVPALLAGAVAARRGSAAATAAALGTGVVTVPLFALGWALFLSRESFLMGVLNALWNTGLLGVLPLVIGVAIARNVGRTREWRAAGH